MKCSYKLCFCEDSDDVIKQGRMKYHADCLKTKNDIYEIAMLFEGKINNHVVFSQLYRVIQNIIFEKGITTEYLKFGLEYYIANKIPLNYPAGLYYVIQNKDVSNAFNKMKAKDIKQKMKSEIDNLKEQEVHHFGYVTKKKQSISDLLGE